MGQTVGKAIYTLKYLAINYCTWQAELYHQPLLKSNFELVDKNPRQVWDEELLLQGLRFSYDIS